MQGVPRAQTGAHEQQDDRAGRFIENCGKVPHLARGKHHALRPVLASRESGFAGKVVGNIAPFLGRAENLAQFACEVMHRLQP